ncbi:MAG: HAMP domain-containing sensor histidine kinase [Rhodospirillaceae bacterium]|nr:HAMP domain-containing sensor histidine kinase [Rhodospirillaceae bacterium]MDD9915512.1 HAMP domain-containing sensor histidine kinase [Rhodospirillaceae bacterium]MDD9928285.1 HAMP domain-containing sensor histidine kinase [Rhodospirillaceae bacterium]
MNWRLVALTALSVGGSALICFGLYGLIAPEFFNEPVAVALPLLTPLVIAPTIIFFTDRIRERLRLQNLELEAARRRAEEADRRKSEFLTVISHEVRTPLTSIKAGLGLLRRDLPAGVGDEVNELVDVAYRNCERLEALINDTLDVQQIEAGAMPLARTRQTARTLLEDAVTENRAYGAVFEVTFEIVEPVPDLAVEGDQRRLMQVFSNLLSNAAKFSPPGAAVELSAQPQDGMLRFAVRDFGGGISPAFQDQVFDKFTQQDTSDERRVGGTGLGLNIARSIVELHGGTIGFDTQAGSGTRFYFDLPVAA